MYKRQILSIFTLRRCSLLSLGLITDCLLYTSGWDVEVVEFNDYVQPNTSLADGEIDANYFQTIRYLEEQNKERGLHLVEVAGIHLEPMGIYSVSYTHLDRRGKCFDKCETDGNLTVS